MQQAAAMMLQGMTARYLLKGCWHVGPGTTLLMHAAAGGVGLIACQWARHLGATVIGTQDHEAIALGHLLAEGNLCHPHSVYFYSQDIDQVKDFVRAANSFENVNCMIATHKSTYSIYAARTDKRYKPGIFTWCGELGLLGKNARTKDSLYGL